MSDTLDTLIAIGLIVGVILVVGLSAAAAAGLDTARDDSEYTGYVVDVENNKGMLLRTTQIKMKTNPRSSTAETFCIHPDDQAKMLPKAQNALQNQSRVTVEYHRPYFVWVGTCQRDASLTDSINVSNQTAPS